MLTTETAIYGEICMKRVIDGAWLLEPVIRKKRHKTHVSKFPFPMSNAANVKACLALVWHYLTSLEIETPLVCTSEITKDKLALLGKGLSHEITKLGLALLNSPSVDTVAPIAELCLNHLTAISCSLRSLLPFAGRTMRKQV